MLSQFFQAPARMRTIRCNPSGTMLVGFAGFLHENGYSQISARRHIRSAEHIVHWASRRGLSVAELNDSTLERFGDHVKRCRCGRYSRARPVNILTGVRLFLRYSQGVDKPAVRELESTDPQPLLLQSFCEWMREQRGTSERTLYNYGIPIGELIRRFGEDPGTLDARRLRNFVLQQSRSTGWAGAKRCTTALRMFLRFLVAEGRCRSELLGAIPVVAHWRASSLPRYLPPEDVECLIGACDRSSSIGKRDRAILLLLARLGLRAGDIVQLRLHDIDWRNAWILVSGKNHRQTRLPLTQEVGEAIVAYVQQGRPCARSDALFLRSRAPFRALASHSAVSILAEVLGSHLDS